MLALAGFAAEDGLRGMVEGAAWAAGAFVGICTAVGLAWKLPPFRWLREQIAEGRAERLAAAIDRQSEPWREEVRDELANVNGRLDMLHEQGARTENDLEQHMTDSREQHRADLERREERQVVRDDLDRSVETRLKSTEDRLILVADDVSAIRRRTPGREEP